MKKEEQDKITHDVIGCAMEVLLLFFSTETQRTQSYTERHCERSEAIQRFLTARDTKIFPQRTQGTNDGVILCVLCAFFANLAVKKPNSINQLKVY